MTAKTRSTYRLGVAVGGTFTDLPRFDRGGSLDARKARCKAAA